MKHIITSLVIAYGNSQQQRITHTSPSQSAMLDHPHFSSQLARSASATKSSRPATNHQVVERTNCRRSHCQGHSNGEQDALFEPRPSETAAGMSCFQGARRFSNMSTSLAEGPGAGQGRSWNYVWGAAQGIKHLSLHKVLFYGIHYHR